MSSPYSSADRASTAAPDTADVDHTLIEIESRQHLFVGINLGVTVVAAATLWLKADRTLLLGWVGYMAAVQTARYLATRTKSRSAARIAWTSTTFAALSGIGWGVGGGLFHGLVTGGGFFLFPFLIAGLTAGVAIAASHHLPSFFAFCVPALAIYGVLLVFVRDIVSPTIGFLLLAYLAGISLIAVQIHRANRAQGARAEALDAARRQLQGEVEANLRQLRQSNEQLSAEIASRKRNEERIHHLLEHDTLTNLANRRLLTQRLEEALERRRTDETLRSAGPLAVMMLDLDRFKEVNDTLGHPAGDELLRQAAARLRSQVPAGVTVARMGGDEFALLHPELSDALEAEHLAETIIQAFQESFDLGRARMQILVSLGIALYPDHGDDADILLSHADQALYEAKSFGRGRYSVFSKELRESIEARHLLEKGLRTAVQEGQLELRFQPRYTLSTRRIVAAEALLRWRHPSLGILPPADFLPIAETTGLLDLIGRHVLAEACDQARLWQNDGLATRAAVNISAVQLQRPDFSRQILAALDAAELAPERLELEIAESACARAPGPTLERELHRLKGLGVRLVLDNFGRGSVPLVFLKTLPFDAVKIDRTFVRRMCIDRRDWAVVKAAITLARALGWTSVAEGVEEEDQLDALLALGCDEAQGFLLGRPMLLPQLQPMLVA
ncbi:MAG: EAL domain-containing protein [Geminicoccaceae bacterium]|nr:EAL domain-containing protein [Geminicoccaceae bacterium]